MFNIIAFVGPSGAGKTTLQECLGCKPIVTWTSRAPRHGEQNGVHYNFSSREYIIEMYRKGLLLEYTEYNGNVYGTDLNTIKNIIGTNDTNSIVLDVKGVKELKELFSENVLVVGVNAPFEECRKRLSIRECKTTTNRLLTYSEEVKSMFELSDIIINNSESNWSKASQLVKTLI